MRQNLTARARYAAFAALSTALFATGFGTLAAGSDSGTPGAENDKQQDKITVVPYKTRSAPSHQVSLRDGRVFFLTELEETETGFVLHTMEDETIEVERDEVEKIVEFKVE